MKALRQEQTCNEYLECEKPWIYALLMAVGGFFGAFTYSIRGGIFCNAQTANFVLFAMAIGSAQWNHALYYLLPMIAYFLGAVVSESVAGPIKRFNLIRWDTLFVFIEMLVVIFLGCLPESAPHQISQVLINFICSMQYNTFRQAQNIPMSTTFCTNHVRQVGVAFSKAVRHKGKDQFQRMFFHLRMLAVFVLAAVISTILCHYFLGKAIFAALIPLSIIFADFLYADLKKEKGSLNRVPHGH